MISQSMTDAINKHMNAEIYSSYLYLSMASQAAHDGFPGMANWFYVQAKEELCHVEKLYAYVNSQGQRVMVYTVDQPPTDFDGPEAMFATTLEHEQLVTGLINKLADLAVEEHDHATQIMLQWFVSEQIEEEESARDILDQIRLTGGAGQALYLIDKELGSRMFTPPA
jgi:ferritin